jgi:TonB-dependent receptor
MMEADLLGLQLNLDMTMKKLAAILSALCILMLLPGTTLFAQGSGTITGLIVDANSGETLIGANVLVKGTNRGSAAGMNGDFTINNVPAGTVTLVASYLSYQTREIDIEVEAGSTITIRIEMQWLGLVGEEVVISVQARGQLSAINQQRASNTISNIVSSDRIQEIPDVNAAESVGRLPGISIQRSGGEANQIAIRGLSPKYNTITVNGVRVPATGSTDRSVDLSLISSNMLDGIEVTKALTPDKDADALGGTVDLKLRTASEGWYTDFLAQGGYTALQQTYGNYKFVGNVSNRFFDNRLGIMLGFNTDRYDRSADKFNGDYSLEIDPADGIRKPQVTALNLREETIDRSRLGGSLIADYRLPRGKVMFNTFFNRLDNVGLQRQNQLQVSDTRHRYTMSDFETNTNLLTVGFGVEQDLKFMFLDAGVSYVSSNRESPLNYYYEFSEESAFIDDAFEEIDRFDPPSEMARLFANNIEQTFLNYGNVRTEKTNENEVTVQGNVKVPFRFGNTVSGYFKTGGKFREMNRSYDVTQFGTNQLFFGGGQEHRDFIATEFPELGLEIGMARLPMSAFQDTYGRSNFLRGDYPLGYTIRGSSMKQIINASRGIFMQQEVQASLGDDYEGTERYTAAYAMTEVNVGRYITFMPGFRWEKEYSSYSAKFTDVQPNPLPGQDPFFTDTTAVRRNDFLLPQVHLQIKPLDWINLRLAYTETLTRPDFWQYSPRIYISQFRDYVTAPNTRIRSATAKNYDASLSIYHNRLGFFTVSAFYKEISDLIWFATFSYVTGQNILPDLVLPPSISGAPRINTSINNPFVATVKGIEFDWQTNFWYLPSFLKGIVLNLNYTHIVSETEYPQFRRDLVPIVPRPPRPPFTTAVLVDTSRVGRMPNQPSDIMNATIGYDLKGFSARVSFLYQTDILTSLATDPAGDRFTDDYFRVDVSVKQNLPHNMQVFANFNNLNNRADYNFQSSIGDYPTFIEYYGFTMDIGVRYKFP